MSRKTKQTASGNSTSFNSYLTPDCSTNCEPGTYVPEEHEAHLSQSSKNQNQMTEKRIHWFEAMHPVLYTKDTVPLTFNVYARLFIVSCRE